MNTSENLEVNPESVESKSNSGMSIRSTREWSTWMMRLAKATHRSRQEVITYSVERYSADFNHPAGPPPSRMAPRATGGGQP